MALPLAFRAEVAPEAANVPTADAADMPPRGRRHPQRSVSESAARAAAFFIGGYFLLVTVTCSGAFAPEHDLDLGQPPAVLIYCSTEASLRVPALDVARMMRLVPITSWARSALAAELAMSGAT